MKRKPQKKYATISWTIGDVQTLFSLSDKQAKAFLEANSKWIKDSMVEAGWASLEHLGTQEGLKRIE